MKYAASQIINLPSETRHIVDDIKDATIFFAYGEQVGSVRLQESNVCEISRSSKESVELVRKEMTRIALEHHAVLNEVVWEPGPYGEGRALYVIDRSSS